jgi:amidase
MSQELWRLDATALAALIRSGTVSAREAVETHLDRLNAVNPRINAVVRVLADEARAEADRADARQRAGEPLGPLHGVPVTTKINSDQAGCPTDNGVVSYRDLIASEDSPQVGSLRRAGAIVIGRTNAPAMSMRGMTENRLHGRTLNPWNRDVTCGGSSGGAGAALAAGIGAIGQGNDIGGSIRWPAYCNGVAGLRPSPGRVPSFNPTATAPRRMSGQLMAVNGPMARSVRDLQLALAAMAVRDPRDPLWVPAPLDGEPLPRPLRVAIVAEPAEFKVDPAVAAAVRRAGSYLATAGYQIEEIEPPELRRVADIWHPIGLADLNRSLRPLLGEIDDPGLTSFINCWCEAKGDANLDEYLLALAERDALVRRWQLFMETYPIVVMPSCGEVALPAGVDAEGAAGAARTVEALAFQLTLPVLGLPGLAVPVGEHEGQPLGVQVVSRRYREDLCLEAGEVIEAHEPPRTPIDPRS